MARLLNPLLPKNHFSYCTPVTVDCPKDFPESVKERIALAKSWVFISDDGCMLFVVGFMKLIPASNELFLTIDYVCRLAKKDGIKPSLAGYIDEFREIPLVMGEASIYCYPQSASRARLYRRLGFADASGFPLKPIEGGAAMQAMRLGFADVLLEEFDEVA